MTRKNPTSFNISEENIKFLDREYPNRSDIVDYLVSRLRVNHAKRKNVINNTLKDIDLYVILDELKRRLILHE